METETCCRGFKMLKIGTAIFVFVIASSSGLSLYFNIFFHDLITRSKSGYDSPASLVLKGILEFVILCAECPSGFIAVDLIVLASCAMAVYSILKDQRMFLIPFMVITILMFVVMLVISGFILNSNRVSDSIDNAKSSPNTFHGAINDGQQNNNVKSIGGWTKQVESNYPYTDFFAWIPTFYFVMALTYLLVIIAIFLHFLMIVVCLFAEMGKPNGTILAQVASRMGSPI